MTSQIYRVDKFIVPAAAQQEFLARVRATHALLRSLPGCTQELLLEQTSGPGSYNYVTLMGWKDQASIDAAKIEVQKLHAKTGFHPQELFSRLGIQADLGNYKTIDGAG
ncbi:antibiotic biosynthesis monooxygenase [Collimonas sp. NPDC087041]|uniref:antibiotic biosynthesis monooxygenase n=1 Tax=Collimonas sp. NPDC087041 TaxID=3363960 RepID=UPI00381FEF39